MKVISLKIKHPNTAKIKYTRINNDDAFNRAGNEKMMVAINLYKPYRFLTSFKILETLKTLNTLIN